jgi:hypothetical protein
MLGRRKILFSVHHLSRLLIEPGFPREVVPALHVCPDGLLFKDSFLSFDDVTAVECTRDLELHDPSLAGQELSIQLAPGEGCLALRKTGPRSHDVVFLVRDADALRDRLAHLWSMHRQDLPPGWRRVRNHQFSLSCPTGWEPEDTRHPDLRLRLFSKADGVLMSLLVYDGAGESVHGIVSGLLNKLQEGADGLRVLARREVRIDGLAGERLTVEQTHAKPPVITDTYLLRGPGQVIELQFLLPSDHYGKACATLERVASAFRWQDDGAA